MPDADAFDRSSIEADLAARLSEPFSAGELVDRYGEHGALIACDVLVAWEDSASDPSPLRLAWLLGEKGSILEQLGRVDDAVAGLGEIVVRFETSSDVALQVQVVRSLYCQGSALVRAGRDDEAAALYDELIARFDSRSDLGRRREIAGDVAWVLMWKAGRLRKEGDAVAAIRTFDRVISDYGDAPEPLLRRYAAGAVKWKLELTPRRRVRERSVLAQQLIRFQSDEAPEVREMAGPSMRRQDLTPDAGAAGP